MNKDKVIMFCPECNWKIINPEEYDKTNTCPKCKSWTLEITECFHYNKGKLIHREFGLTDNDEIWLSFYSKAEAKRVISKAFKLFEEEDGDLE